MRRKRPQLARNQAAVDPETQQKFDKLEEVIQEKKEEEDKKEEAEQAELAKATGLHGIQIRRFPGSDKSGMKG